MDDTITVEYNEKSLYEAAEYILGHFCKITNKKLVIVDANMFDSETLNYCQDNNLLIPIPNRSINIKFKPPKTRIFANKLDRLYSLLVTFINVRCVIGVKFKVLAADLLAKFSTEIGEDVNNKIEFPLLMKRYINNNQNLQIDKYNTARGVIYVGIDLNTTQNWN